MLPSYSEQTNEKIDVLRAVLCKTSSAVINNDPVHEKERTKEPSQVENQTSPFQCIENINTQMTVDAMWWEQFYTDLSRQY